MGYDYLLLDADGTVLDFDKAERTALIAALKQFSVDPSEETIADYHRINKALWEALERGELTRDRLSVLRFEQLGHLHPGACAEMAPVYMEQLSRCAFFLPGAEDFLLKASKLCSIAIVTNGLTRVQKGRLKGCNMSRFSRVFVISQDLGVSKPDALIAKAALEGLGCTDPARALVAGDSVSADIMLARNAGLRSCLMFSSSPLADYCTDTYDGLLSLLGGKKTHA